MAQRQRNDLGIYDRVARSWWSDEIRWVRVLKAMVPGRLSWFDRQVRWPARQVLDLGCAGGFMAEAMAWRGAVVTGIDPAREAIEAARRHAEQEGLDIRYDVGAGEALPYDDGRFDVVVCVDVLEHVRDLGEVLREVARVLRPGGLFLFDTINRNPIARFATITMAEDVIGLLPRGTHDPERFITPAEMRRGLRAASLEPGSFVGLGPRWMDRRGNPVFGRVPSTAIIYMGLARRI